MVSVPYRKTGERMQSDLLIAGGTMFSEETPYGLKPVTDARQLLEKYAGGLLEAYGPTVVELFRMDSTDMHFRDYLAIAGAVSEKVRNGRRSVIVAQGTDSMTYANAFFTVRFPFKDFHLGITGSMYPISAESSDAQKNLSAALAAGEEWEKWTGTYNYINNGEVLRASRSVKMRPNRIEQVNGTAQVVPERRAFESINYPVLGHLNERNGDKRIGFARRQNSEALQARFLSDQQDRRGFFKELSEQQGYPLFFGDYTPVHVAELHPNYDPKRELDPVTGKYKVFLIKATGTGGVFNTPKQMEIIPRIADLTKHGQFVVITSRVPQAIVETSYEVNRRALDAGAVLTADMHSEMVLVKAEFMGALATTPKQFEELMFYPIEEEINPSILPYAKRTTDDEMLRALRGVRSKKAKD